MKKKQLREEIERQLYEYYGFIKPIVVNNILKLFKEEDYGDITGLEVWGGFEDVNTYDQDFVIIQGNNRKEIMSEVVKLLTKKGFGMYGKLHKWRLFKKGSKNKFLRQEMREKI